VIIDLSDPVVVPVSEKKPAWLVGLLNVVALSVALSFLFVYVELMLTAQLPYWTGGSIDDWYETAQALGIYLTAMTVGSLVPFCVLAPFLMVSSLRHGLSVVIPFVVALGFWVYLDSAVDVMPPPLRFGVPATLVVVMAIVSILGIARIAQPAVTGALFLIAITGGIATLYVSAGDQLLEPDGAQRMIMASILWCSISGVGALAVCVATVKAWPRWAVRIVSSLILCGLYPGFLFVQPHVDRLVETDEHKNVLLITVDTLRADSCSAYGGSVPTPNLEALASDGVLFDRHYALAPWTVPSVNALMTSQYPPGLTPNASPEQRASEERSYQKLAGYWLDRDGVTFTKRLGNLGYETGAVYANPTIEFQEWLTHGFKGKKLVNSMGDREFVRFRQTPILREVLGKYREEFLEDRVLDSSAVVTQFGLSYLRRHRAEPFFLWLHFMDPHTPYDPPKRFRMDETPWNVFPPESATLDIDAEGQLSDVEKRAAQSLYEAEVQYVDDCVGRVLSELRDLDLEDETIVCFTSDHGEEFWDHTKWGHGYDLYDEQVRVPLIMAGPKIMPNEIAVPVSAIDVLPTIAELLGHGINPEWRGTSLVSVLAGGDAEAIRRPVFSQATHYFRYNPEPMQMVVDRNLKLIVGLETGTRRLYDLSDDPGEETNLADSMPDAVERLLDMLEVWSAGFPSDFDEVSGWRGGDTASPVDPEFDEALKALGYT